MGFRLRYLTQDLELSTGDFVVGRSAECQLSIDDPLVSRKHAVFVVATDSVSVRDLGSRNGVLVGGQRISGEKTLTSGDRVTIGGQDMTVYWVDEMAQTSGGEDFRRATLTFHAPTMVPDDEPTSPLSGLAPSTRSANTLRLLTTVADKALALGRAEEAERILSSVLHDLRDRAKGGEPQEAVILETAAKYAAKLAGATNKPSWVDYVFELYAPNRKPVAAAVVDELYNVVRRVKGVDTKAFKVYLADLKQASSSFGPADRFVLQRLEGLEKLLAL